MKKYKTFNINEYKHSLIEQELMEMANVTEKTTGIENVVIWIGPNPTTHGKRIKISNVPNKFDGKDCFTMTIPDFFIIGETSKYITQEKIEQIKKFVNLNLEIIIQYSDYLISTEDLLNNLKSI